MTWIAIVTIGILAVTAVIGVVRLYTARDDASVAAVSDLVYFCGIGMIALGAVLVGSSITLDVLAIGALLGILATVALSRILTRGRR
jgi:multicomponent Na+:H+ antiporter subunit F